MVILKDLKDSNSVCLNCNNHSGCTSDSTPDGGGMECGGSVSN